MKNPGSTNVLLLTLGSLFKRFSKCESHAGTVCTIFTAFVDEESCEAFPSLKKT